MQPLGPQPRVPSDAPGEKPRLLAYTMLFGAGMSASFMVLFWVTVGPGSAVLSCAALAVISAFIPQLRRWGTSLHVTGLAMSLPLVIMLGATSWTFGGLEVLPPVWLVALPLVMSVLFTRSALITSTAMAVAMLALMGIAGATSGEPEGVLPAGLRTPINAINGAMAVLFVAWFADYSWRRRQRTLDGLSAALDELRASEANNQGLFRELEAANRRLADEIAGRKRIEVELRHAQKLEAVGQLASGVAHEINTPVQYVGDSVRFLERALSRTGALVEELAELCATSGYADRVEHAKRRARWPYLSANIPGALACARDGVDRVASIVAAMKEFGHPDDREQNCADLNHAIESTLVVARNEYKYVADVETDLGPLPPVMCYLGDLNQVFLNLVVNAAHAIADARDEGERGRIRISTRVDREDVVIQVSDDGTGMAPTVRDRIFDPFFTTKEVGRGTGQGLAIAHAIVVDKHGGSISVDTAPGLGSTFTVRLPIAGRPPGRISSLDLRVSA